MTVPASDTETARVARPGPRPLAAPAVGYAGALLALALLGIAVVALRDAAVSAGWLNGTRWVDSAIEWLDGLSFAGWMVPVGVVAVVAGAWLLLLAALPRRQKAVQADARSSVWIEYNDLARAAARLAVRVPGVLSARATASRRRITVIAGVTADSGSTAETIDDAVRSGLSGILAEVPAVRTRTRAGGQ
ncbi:DUF6286 domain-containing protein [Nocardia higoensis]|uniref:DUF6286 domain-containing protein n=1 Tax=Nocardia higoensis TaxID=228599 RepID=UPI0003082177|nr:DUF6286 domain-containing protein [Nocardia higoensis]